MTTGTGLSSLLIPINSLVIFYEADNAVVDGVVVDHDADADVGNTTQSAETDLSVVHDCLVKNLYLRDFLIGHGYPTMLMRQQLSNPDTDTDLAALVKNLDLNAQSTTLLPPKVNFLRDGDQQTVGRILDEMEADNRYRFQRYLEHTVLGMIGISGIAGSGKTQHLAICALMLLA
ncbi:hypothetical protein Sste5344_001325 [Sporothrix stenoceras]